MQTAAYADLTFAFGFARLGEADRSRTLEDAATARLTATGDPVHAYLLAAFRHRIADARAGRPHDGPLPAFGVPLEPMQAYTASRFRERSRVLEPSEPVDALQQHGLFAAELDPVMRETDPDRFRAGVLRLLVLATTRRDRDDFRRRVLVESLPRSNTVGQQFASELLTNARSLLSDRQGEPNDRDRLLAETLAVAVRLGREDAVFELVVLHLRPFLDTGDAAPLLRPACADCIVALAQAGQRDRLAELFDMISERISAGGDWQAALGPYRVPRTNTDSDESIARCKLGAGWRYLGNETQAAPLLDAVRAVLAPDSVDRLRALTRANIIRQLTDATSQAPLDRAESELRTALGLLTGLPSAFTTHAYFSLLHIELIESIVLAVAHDDFAPPDHRRVCGDAERAERVALLCRLHDALPALTC